MEYPPDLDRGIEALQERRAVIAERISKLNAEWDELMGIEIEFKYEKARRAYAEQEGSSGQSV